ncbi:CHAT domain-containing protein [bacterium]|nr:CHAT domain-containing protein [bacterium]
MENFDLRVSQGENGGLRVGVAGSHAGEVAPVAVQTPADTAFDLRNKRDAEVRGLGASFTAQVMPTVIWQAWRESLAAAGEHGLRLRIRSEEGAGVHLPWELLYDAERRTFLAQDPHSPIVRYLEGPIVNAAQPIAGPLRLLLTSANPADLDPLNVEAELNNITATLSAADASNRVAVTRINHLSADALDRGLLEAKPHLFHFSGHAAWDDAAGDGGAATGHLLLEDGRGGVFGLADAMLAMFLRNRGVALAVLNACESAQGNAQWAGLAHALVLAGVPAVVAMQSPVTDGAAAAFTGTLYAALANRYSLEQAVTLARQTVARQRLPVAGPGAWLAPVLFMRSGSERFWVHDEVAEKGGGVDGVPAQRIDIGKIEAVNFSMGNQTIDQRGAEINVGGKTVNTGGGAFIGGNVTAGGDFVGCDKIVYGREGEPELAKAFTQLSAFIALHVASCNVQLTLQLVSSMQQALVQGNDEQVADCIAELSKLLPKEALTTALARPAIQAHLGPAARYVVGRIYD